MTLSKKYNEIMDKVVVTDEMRRRVLKEISSADPERLAAYKMDADEDLSNNLAQLKKTRESLKNYQMSGGSKRPSARQKKNTQ